jgi:hypothetical protein
MCPSADAVHVAAARAPPRRRPGGEVIGVAECRLGGAAASGRCGDG